MFPVGICSNFNWNKARLSVDFHNNNSCQHCARDVKLLHFTCYKLNCTPTSARDPAQQPIASAKKYVSACFASVREALFSVPSKQTRSSCSGTSLPRYRSLWHLESDWLTVSAASPLHRREATSALAVRETHAQLGDRRLPCLASLAARFVFDNAISVSVQSL